MRIFEFAGDDNMDKFIVVIKNFIGRYASKGESAKLNWKALDRVLQSSGVELTADYETFKAMYDSSPPIQALVKNFNQDGIVLNVPGAKDDAQPKQGDEKKDSAQTVADIAAGAAAGQLAKSQAGVQA